MPTIFPELTFHSDVTIKKEIYLAWFAVSLQWSLVILETESETESRLP